MNEFFRNNEAYKSEIMPPLTFIGITRIPKGGKYGGRYTAFDGTVYLKTGEFLYAIDSESKEIKWEKEGKNIGFVVAGMDNYLFLKYNSKPSCIDSESGRINWQFENDGGITHASKNKIYCHVKKEGEWFIHCLSKENGELVWELPDPFSSNSFMVEKDVGVIGSRSGIFAIEESTGKVLWSTEENEWLEKNFPDNAEIFKIPMYDGPTIEKNFGPLIDGIFYAGYNNRKGGKLVAVSALTGEKVWDCSVKEYPDRIIFSGGKLYFNYFQGRGSVNHLGCVDAATGEHLYEIEENFTPAGCHNPIISNNYFIGGAGPYLSFFDLDKKEFAWKYKQKKKKDIFSGNIYVYKDHLVAYMMEEDELYWFQSRDAER
jgi:outer membrane protein assembly factor BamB